MIQFLLMIFVLDKIDFVWTGIDLFLKNIRGQYHVPAHSVPAKPATKNNLSSFFDAIKLAPPLPEIV